MEGHNLTPGNSRNERGHKYSENQTGKQKNINDYGETQKLFFDSLKYYLSTQCVLRYNRVSENIDIKWITSKKWEPIEDRSFYTLMIRSKKAGIKVNKEIFKSYLNSDNIHGVNPIKEAIERYSTYHPSASGVIDKLASTVRVDNQARWPLYFKKWLVGMVSNIFNDSRCTNHICLTLSGEQGRFKSTFIANLIPDELRDYRYIGKIAVNGQNNKDTLSLLATKLLIIIDDQLQQINRKDENEIKELITKDTVTWRKPFATFDITRPHRSSFAATVNGLEFLTDLTGSRRYLPFEVLSINIDQANKIDKQEVFAEAYQLYISGFRYWFNDAEVDELNRENEKYRISSREYDLLLRHIDFDDSSEFITATEVLQRLEYLGETKSLSIKKVGEALKKLNIPKVTRKIAGRATHGYFVKIGSHNKDDSGVEEM